MKKIIAILLLLTVCVTSAFSESVAITDVFSSYKEDITKYLIESNTYAKYGDVVYEEEVQITSAKNIKLLNSLMEEVESYQIAAENKELSSHDFTDSVFYIENVLYKVKTNNIYCAAWIVLDDSYNFEFTTEELELLEWAKEYYAPYF